MSASTYLSEYGHIDGRISHLEIFKYTSEHCHVGTSTLTERYLDVTVRFEVSRM
jgi:hypothetical protein